MTRPSVEPVEADFLAHQWIKDEGERRSWMVGQIATMKTDGARYFRVSHPEAYPQDLWVEGWKVRPDDQGSPPWEAGLPASTT